ncbi:C-type lectin domain family 4 member C [Armadillidium nasatum]|uniref:C-type lectin domain family 4 member C n=1 Tax=Armadillidium nasatum TaxID=96803 RepID=A0A5N5SMQ9_9CRUS|nr:C-type lectin domain family 4 member C [Armadillidium nasatum]
MNYGASQVLCEVEDAHLLYIPDCNKFSFIVQYIMENHSTPEGTGYWIGATDDAEEGNWVWGNGYPVRMGVPFWGTSGENWDLEPNGGSDENCAQLSTSDQFYFHDEDCLEGFGSPICQKGLLQETNEYSQSLPELSGSEEEGFKLEVETCPENFTYIGRSCFFFGIDMTKQTFESASDFCRSINAQLPILKDCFEFQELVEQIERNYALGTNESYWIGASDRGDEGEWLWSDFTEVEMGPPFWGSTNGTAEPSGDEDQNCAILYKNDRYYFHDGECHMGTKILCQTTPFTNSKTNGYP